MRSVPTSLASKLAQAIQNQATNAAPAVDLWLSRPTTAIVSPEFLEKQVVTASADITDIAIAACHPILYRPVTKIYEGYVSNGFARVRSAVAREAMEAHTWVDSGFHQPASAIALEFDGTMPKDRKGRVEFVTQLKPWVFWVNGGALYGCVLGDEDNAITLAESNVTDVFAVRGTHSDVGGFDFGLIVFFILAGSIYYRQLIDSEWYDAAPISFGPAGPFERISAMRTWDYRVVVQAWDTSGVLHELFSQYQGIGKQNVEHLEIADITAKGTLIDVDYLDAKSEDEHIEIASISAGALYGGLYSVATPAIVSARNIPVEVEVEGEMIEDWGKALVVKFNVHLVAADVTANATRFVLTDANSATYTATSAVLGADGKTVTLTFTDFNAAKDECQIGYTPGTAYSMATVAIPPTSFSFTPINLNAPDVDAPEFMEAWNE